MIKYYWKQAWELLKQHKLFSVLYITGAGLAIAMTMVVFVAHYIRVAPVYPETNRAETWVLKSVTVQRVKTRGSGSWQSNLVTVLAEASIHNESGVKAIPIDVPENEMVGCVHTLKDNYRKRSMLEFIKILSESVAVRERIKSWL